eukprot:gb/GECG01012937.1/.p1 GENE.gb/GECG01012937.1/~~gb/GECG01012937.1/.p1  ORF type:complete len:168 (+),score=12.83 gb/GECG01012937.1/:1-504(+)
MEAIPFNIRHCVAPMVGQSDLAYRLLCREIYAQEFASASTGKEEIESCNPARIPLHHRSGGLCCYTEMIQADLFVQDETHRAKYLQTTAQDRPLVVQFCGNDPEVLAEACSLLGSEDCDAIVSITHDVLIGTFLEGLCDIYARNPGPESGMSSATSVRRTLRLLFTG